MRQLDVEPSLCLLRQSALTPSSPEDPPMQQKVAQTRPDLAQHLTQAILASKSPQAALVNVSQVIGETFHAEACLIMPQSRSQATAHPGYWVDKELQTVPSQDLLASVEHLVNQANWSEEQFLAVPQPQAITQSDQINPDLQSKSVVLVGTQFQGQVNGVIALVQSQPYSWKESDVHLLQSLSPQVAIAISQAQLEYQLQQQVRYQSLIDQLTAAIRNAWELEEIFKLAVEGTASALEVNRSILLLFKYEDPLYKTRNLEGIPKTKAHVVAEWSQQVNAEESPIQASSTQNTSFWASNCYVCQQVLTGKLDPVIIAASESALSSEEADANQEIAPVFQLQPPHALLLLPLENQG
ncbi:MAG TPA: GAF domain-containing protein, partial [Coleofasciculaceae cyanobacterium]